MLDRDGTIKRLQDSLKVVNGWCCRTDSLNDPIMNVERAMEDALELLNGFVNPLLTKQSIFGSNRVCSKCKRYLFPAGRYCPHCGRAVKWDD